MGWSTFHGAGSEYLGFSHSIFADTVSRNTHLLLDRGHRVIGVLVGQPQGAHDWKAVHDDSLDALQSAAADMRFTEKEGRGGRRGSFPTVAHGLSYGGGQRVSACPLPHCLLTSSCCPETRLSPPQLEEGEGVKGNYGASVHTKDLQVWKPCVSPVSCCPPYAFNSKDVPHQNALRRTESETTIT